MRTYSEQEVADIIARAAERQAASAREPVREGLTLDEIERLGADAGLDADDLRAAAAEIDAAGRTLSRQASHTKTHVAVERWIDAELTPQAWEDAVAEMRDHFGPTMAAAFGMAAGGTVQQIGQAYEWTHTSGFGIQTTVTASPRGERTRLRLTQLVGMASPRVEGVVYGLIPASIVAALSVAATAGAFAWVIAAAFVLSFAVTLAISAPVVTALDRRWRSGKLRDLEALADDVAATLASAPPEFAAEAPRLEAPDETAPAPLRDAFEALESEEADAEARDRRRDRA